jgi:hypothetical protein
MFMRPSARGGICVRFRPTPSYAALNADEKLHIMLPNTWSTTAMKEIALKHTTLQEK